MAFVEKYYDRYDYVPFKTNWFVDVRSKRHLLKDSVVDKDVLSKMSLAELQTIVNPRNVDVVERIIKEKLKEQKRLLKESQQFEYAKKQAKKQEQKYIQEKARQAAKRTVIRNCIALECPNLARAMGRKYA